MTWGFAFPGAVFWANTSANRAPALTAPAPRLRRLVRVGLIGGSSEHISDPGRMPTDHMGVHPERDRRVSVPESVSHDVHRGTCDQRLGQRSSIDRASHSAYGKLGIRTLASAAFVLV
jgi:hypothetical protein